MGDARSRRAHARDRRLAGAASRRFADIVATAPAPGWLTGGRSGAWRAGDTEPGGLLGLEHEYRVLDGAGQIDFRALLAQGDVDGRRLDPGDPNARRCRWGGVITADGREAEVAVPPVPRHPGFSAALAGWARRGASELERVLPPGARLEGFSTHVSVAMPDRCARRVAEIYARTFAAGLMLLMDRVSSPGLLVRPRPGRLELCGEHVTGAHLRAVSVFAAGSAAACAAAATTRGRRARALVPAPLAVSLAPATGRYGIYVDRAAFGTDLYARGRRARLPLAGGGTISAQAHLESCWAHARAALGDGVGDDDVRAVDLLVCADLPLPCEHAGAVTDVAPPARIDPGAWGAIVDECDRPGFRVRPLVATWHATVVELRAGDRSGVACIPAPDLDRFVGALRAGELDGVVSDFLATRPTGRNLRAVAQTGEPALYDGVEAGGTGLVLGERGPDGRLARAGGGGGTGRERKHDSSRAPRPRKLPQRGVLVGAIAVLAVVLAAIAATALGGDDEPDDIAAVRSTTTTAADTTTTLLTGERFGQVVALQDGIFTTSVEMELSTAEAGIGDVVTVTTRARSEGPNWGFRTAPDGSRTYATSCSPIGSSVPQSPGPYVFAGGAVDEVTSADVTDALSGEAVEGIEPVNGYRTVDGPIEIITEGCEATWLHETTFTFTVALPPGAYYLGAGFIYREWTASTPRRYEHQSGEYPVLVVRGTPATSDATSTTFSLDPAPAVPSPNGGDAAPDTGFG
jgi:hypothetical protein